MEESMAWLLLRLSKYKQICQMVPCSKDLFYTRTCEQLESSPASCAQARLTLLWEARLEWLSFYCYCHRYSHPPAAIGICSNHSIRGRLLGWLLVIVDHRPTAQLVVLFGGNSFFLDCFWLTSWRPTLGMTRRLKIGKLYEWRIPSFQR